jgi:phosphate transport system substrate-binding protein
VNPRAHTLAKAVAFASFLALSGASALAGAPTAELAPYRPEQKVSGDIRVWGSPEDRDLLELWEAGFRKHQPQAHLALQPHGPESTMAGIYTGVADLAFVGRELRAPVEYMAFEWVKLYKPTIIEVANAGLRSRRLAANLAVFVHRDNPLTGLSVAQLDGIFGAEHKRGPANLRTWGDLGLTGEWRDRSIHVLAPPVNSISALFFRKTVLDDSFKWNASLEEFPSEAQALTALARDPGGIAYAPLAAANDAVKALPLAATSAGPFVALTTESAADRSYPLSRAVIVVLDRAPGKPIDPRIREFLRFVLSAEGQAAVARDGSYIPLLAQSAQQQLKRLD